MIRRSLAAIPLLWRSILPLNSPKQLWFRESSIWTKAPVLPIRDRIQIVGRSPNDPKRFSAFNFKMSGAPLASFSAAPPPPTPRLAQAPPTRAYFLRRLEICRTPKPLYTHRFNHINITTFEIYSSAQTPRIPWPPRSRMPSRLLLPYCRNPARRLFLETRFGRDICCASYAKQAKAFLRAEWDRDGLRHER